MKRFSSYMLFILSFSLAGCMSAGTHGSIKSYRYAINKDSLQSAIMTIIKGNRNIYRDTSLDHLGTSPLLDHSDGKDYSAGDNFYNDIKHYVTIKITSGLSVNEYIFRYYGSAENWKNSSTSEIFICYAHDKNGNGGSEGDGGISKKMAKEFTEVFEKEFVNKIDKQLNLAHIETK